MKRGLFALLAAGLISIGSISIAAPAAPPAPPAPPKPPATKPAVSLGKTTDAYPRKARDGSDDARWLETHKKFVEEANATNGELLLVGDSITQGWRTSGKDAWKSFADFKPMNLGISGDRTQHVIWRLQNGGLDKIKPKVVVVMIGTNNVGGAKPAEIADGVKAVVDVIRQKQPAAKVLLLGVFPRAAKSDDAPRKATVEINAALKAFNWDANVKFLDIGAKFLADDGTLSKDIMPDMLHLSPKGYQIWADAVVPEIKELAK